MVGDPASSSDMCAKVERDCAERACGDNEVVGRSVSSALNEITVAITSLRDVGAKLHDDDKEPCALGAKTG